MEQPLTVSRIVDFGESSSLAQWTDLATGDTGAPFPQSSWSDRSVQVSGTFGAGGTLSLEGSNDGTNWALLRDPFGADLAVTAAGIFAVMEITRFVRPHVTAGDGATLLDVALLARR